MTVQQYAVQIQELYTCLYIDENHLATSKLEECKCGYLHLLFRIPVPLISSFYFYGHCFSYEAHCISGLKQADVQIRCKHP